MYNACSRAIKFLFCLVFIIDHTRLDRSRLFNFGFNVDQIYTICHIILLSYFYHRPDSIRSVMEAQFCFWRGPHLYNQSHSCFIWFLSYLEPDRSITTIQYRFLINCTYTIIRIIILSGFRHRLHLVDWSQ